MVNPRFVQLLGIILVILAAAMAYLVYTATVSVPGELGTLLVSGMIDLGNTWTP